MPGEDKDQMSLCILAYGTSTMPMAYSKHMTKREHCHVAELFRTTRGPRQLTPTPNLRTWLESAPWRMSGLSKQG